MKVTTKWDLNLKTKEVKDKVNKANRQGLRDSIVDIANDVIQLSPILTGHNRRSIMFEVGPGGQVAKGDSEVAVYSTSGYGGFLETGTARRSATPYFRPALDKNIKNLPKNIKVHLG